jgi:hypothetical protein
VVSSAGHRRPAKNDRLQARLHSVVTAGAAALGKTLRELALAKMGGGEAIRRRSIRNPDPIPRRNSQKAMWSCCEA